MCLVSHACQYLTGLQFTVYSPTLLQQSFNERCLLAPAPSAAGPAESLDTVNSGRMDPNSKHAHHVFVSRLGNFKASLNNPKNPYGSVEQRFSTQRSRDPKRSRVEKHCGHGEGLGVAVGSAGSSPLALLVNAMGPQISH